MKDNPHRGNSILSNLPIYVFGFIIVGLFMGGIYSLPAMRLTKDTDPWLTILLGVGLTITVSILGVMAFTSYLHVLYAVLIANTLLVIRRSLGKMDHNVERFGMIHALSVLGFFCYTILLEK
jgi:hypothetical protein